MRSSYHSSSESWKSAKGPAVRVADGGGEHLRQDGHALAVPAGMRRLRVDRRRNGLDEALEQLSLVLEQHLVVERDAGLRRERLDDALVLFGKRNHAARRGIPGIQELQHADHEPLAIDERDGQKRLRAVVVLRVEGLGTAEVEARGVVGVGDVHGALQ